MAEARDVGPTGTDSQPNPRLRHRGWYLALDVVVVSSFFLLNVVLIRLIHGAFDDQFALTVMVGVNGLIIGALVSYVATPYSGREDRQWSRLGAAAAGLLAGFSAGIFSDSVSYLFKDARLFNDAAVGARVSVFLAWLGFGLIYGFTYRRYYVEFDLVRGWDPVDEGQQRPSSPIPK